MIFFPEADRIPIQKVLDIELRESLMLFMGNWVWMAYKGERVGVSSGIGRVAVIEVTDSRQIGYWKLENGAALISPVCERYFFHFVFFFHESLTVGCFLTFSPPRLKRILGMELVPRGHYIAAAKKNKRKKGKMAMLRFAKPLC